MHVDTIKFYKYKPVDKPQFADKFCGLPFDSLQIDIDGDVQLCDCQFHMPYTVGNIYQNTLQEIWLGSEAAKVRQAVVDGKFTYCSWDCAKLHTLPARNSSISHTVKNFPRTIKIDLDRSCNLSCPSCREHVIIEKNLERIHKQTEIYQELKQWAKDNPKTYFNIKPCTSGEIFASHSGLTFLKSLTDFENNNLKISLTTNATLLNKNRELFLSLKHLLTDVSISIDAATPETYSVVRGGDWNELLKGLELVKQTHIKPTLNFVIQRDNYKEILQFGEFAKQHNARSIMFASLQDWGHWNIQWWKDNTVIKQNSPELEYILQCLNVLKQSFNLGLSADIQNLMR